MTAMTKELDDEGTGAAVVDVGPEADVLAMREFVGPVLGDPPVGLLTAQPGERAAETSQRLGGRHRAQRDEPRLRPRRWSPGCPASCAGLQVRRGAGGAATGGKLCRTSGAGQAPDRWRPIPSSWIHRPLIGALPLVATSGYSAWTATECALPLLVPGMRTSRLRPHSVHEPGMNTIVRRIAPASSRCVTSAPNWVTSPSAPQRLRYTTLDAHRLQA